ESVETASKDMEDVADGGAGGARHDRDVLRQHRNRLLARRVEESLVGETFLQLLKSQLQRTEARRLRRNRIELKFSLLFVDRESAPNDQLQTVLDAKSKESRLRIEQHYAHLRACIFDREVAVAGRRPREIRHLAFNRDVVVAKKVEIDLTDQLA